MNIEPLEIGGQLGVLAEKSRLPIRGDRFGGVNMSPFLPMYYELAKRGILFNVSTPAAGAAVPAYTTAAQQFLIYNPEGSGVDIVVLRAWLGYVSTTTAAGHFCWAGAVGQSLPGTITNAYVQPALMKQKTSNPANVGQKGVYCAPGSPSVALVATDYMRPFGTSTVAQTAAGTNAPWNMTDEVEGSIVVPERGLVVIAGNIALLGVCAMSAIVAEIPR